MLSELRYTEVGRSGGGGAWIILPVETEVALRERNHAQEKSGGLLETMNGAPMASLLRSSKKPLRIDRPSCLENARPKGEMLIS